MYELHGVSWEEVKLVPFDEPLQEPSLAFLLCLIIHCSSTLIRNHFQQIALGLDRRADRCNRPLIERFSTWPLTFSRPPRDTFLLIGRLASLRCLCQQLCLTLLLGHPFFLWSPRRRWLLSLNWHGLHISLAVLSFYRVLSIINNFGLFWRISFSLQSLPTLILQALLQNLMRGTIGILKETHEVKDLFVLNDNEISCFQVTFSHHHQLNISSASLP